MAHNAWPTPRNPRRVTHGPPPRNPQPALRAARDPTPPDEKRMLRGPALIRRREVWLPTLWGGLLLLALLALLGIALARGANSLLAPTEPARGADGRGARTLVVEGWLDAGELAQAVGVYRRASYDRVLTTGGPIERWDEPGGAANYAERAAAHLRTHGLADVPLIALPAPASAQERTYLSAVMVRDWAARSGLPLQAIDVFSAGVHARRSRLLYRMALGKGVEVGVIAAQPSAAYSTIDPQRWWASSAGAKATLGEALSLVWTTCCFWPAPAGSHEERWAVPAAP